MLWCVAHVCVLTVRAALWLCCGGAVVVLWWCCGVSCVVVLWCGTLKYPCVDSKRLRVYIKNVPVYAGNTRTCFSTCFFFLTKCCMDVWQHVMT